MNNTSIPTFTGIVLSLISNDKELTWAKVCDDIFDDTFAFEDLRFAHKIEIKKNKFRYIYFDIKCQV